jgi:hypothetical protein
MGNVECGMGIAEWGMRNAEVERQNMENYCELRAAGYLSGLLVIVSTDVLYIRSLTPYMKLQ